MKLEILINRAEHPHENEQFYRVARIIEKALEHFSLDGLLISNPTHTSYSSFRPDALLYYSDKIILIDFKDYSGVLDIPIQHDQDRYEKAPWKITTDSGETVTVKGGASVNPFDQLFRYRRWLKDILLDSGIDNRWKEHSIYNFNIFSGPIVHNPLPKSIRYYQLMDEDSLAKFLDEFASNDQFDPANADELKKLFPGTPWVPYEVASPAPISTELSSQPEPSPSDATHAIDDFLSKKEADILIMSSFDRHTRDIWAQYAQDHARDYNISQAEILAHSYKVCSQIGERSRIDASSLYSTIYDKPHFESSKIEDFDANDTPLDEQTLFPIKTLHEFDEGTLFILHEAHLINDEKHGEEDIQFGSGHLLRDFLQFTMQVKDSRVVIIGDPYSLSHGDWKKSALSLESIKKVSSEFQIIEYKERFSSSAQNGHEALRLQLADRIDKKIFNRLDPLFDGCSLEDITSADLRQLFTERFSKGFSKAPETIILLSKREDCRKMNKWIQGNIRGISSPLGKGDLLILEKSCIAESEDGDSFQVMNGSFLTVESIHEEKKVCVPFNKQEISFTFYRIKANILEEHGSRRCSIWVDGRFLQNEAGILSDIEKQQYKILYSKLAKAYRFTQSNEYKVLCACSDYQRLTAEHQQDLKQLAENYGLAKDLQHKVSTKREVRSLLTQYYRKFLQRINSTDPIINAARVHLGWSITPNKALGMVFQEVFLNAESYHQQHACEDYFRWLYTAISTGHNVKMKSFHPISPTSSVQICEIAERISAKDSKTSMEWTNYTVPAEYKDIFDVNEHINVKAAACELIKNSSFSGFCYHSFERKSEYLTRLTLVRTGDDGTLYPIDIYNKGSKDGSVISKIAPTNAKKLTIEDRDTMNAIIKNLFQNGSTDSEPQSHNDSLSCDLETTYTKWKKNFATAGLILNKIATYPYQDVFEAGSITFRAWYDKKGFITKIEVHGTDEETMIRLIKE